MCNSVAKCKLACQQYIEGLGLAAAFLKVWHRPPMGPCYMRRCGKSLVLSTVCLNFVPACQPAPPCLQLRAEHKAVAAKHGSTLSLASLKAMPYTEAAISETLRLAQV